MARYKCVSLGENITLSDGQVLVDGSRVHLSDRDADLPENAALIEAGRLERIPDSSVAANTSSEPGSVAVVNDEEEVEE